MSRPCGLQEERMSKVNFDWAKKENEMKERSKRMKPGIVENNGNLES